MGSDFGKICKISTFGESHGKALGVIIDGCPAGLEISENTIQVQRCIRRLSIFLIPSDTACLLNIILLAHHYSDKKYFWNLFTTFRNAFA